MHTRQTTRWLWPYLLVLPILVTGCAEIDVSDGDGGNDVESLDDIEKQTVPTCPPNGGCGSGRGLVGVYFDNKDFTGASIARVDPVVSFDWGRGSPDPSMGVDTFSVRWTGFVTAQHSETHTFYTVSDDGVRLWVGEQLIIDNWTVHSPTENKATLALEKGRSYPIKLEYFDNGGGAVTKLLWSSPSIAKQTIPEAALSRVETAPETGLSAVYFDNSDFSGATVERIDPVVNFSWGSGSPDPRIGADSFSARWKGFVQAAQSATYTFYTLSDDGIRLKVDGKVVVENWTVHGPTENSGSIALSAGRRTPIELEFFENRSGATAKLSWSSPSVPKQIIPESFLFNRASTQTDLCPADPNKTEPGACGCGTADTDLDGDSVPNCNDACPSDPSKTEQGVCGCGTPDTDANGNGVPDCNDEEDATCGRLDASVDTSKEQYASQRCCLCGNCAVPAAERRSWYVDPHQKTCVQLENEVYFKVQPLSEQCFETQRQHRETCCNAQCKPAPIEQAWKPVSVPFPAGQYTHCDLCKNGQYPRNPNNVATIASVPGNPRCADLYWMGRTNNLPVNICYPAQSLLEEGCGCLAPAQQYPQGNEPRCDICPNGQVPMRRGVYLNDLPGNPSCMDLYWKGRTGNLSSGMCEQVKQAPNDPCGCVPAQ